MCAFSGVGACVFSSCAMRLSRVMAISIIG
jgi:hypothetical protein